MIKVFDEENDSLDQLKNLCDKNQSRLKYLDIPYNNIQFLENWTNVTSPTKPINARNYIWFEFIVHKTNYSESRIKKHWKLDFSGEIHIESP